MELEKEIKKLVRERVIEEINGLGIRAVIKEKIEASGVTKGAIKELISSTVDSYVRSVDIVALVDSLITEFVRKSVKDAVQKYVSGYFGNATTLLEKLIQDELRKEWNHNYSAKVNIIKKEAE
jgi:hypothetical protein